MVCEFCKRNAVTIFHTTWIDECYRPIKVYLCKRHKTTKDEFKKAGISVTKVEHLIGPKLTSMNIIELIWRNTIGRLTGIYLMRNLGHEWRLWEYNILEMKWQPFRLKNKKP